MGKKNKKYEKGDTRPDRDLQQPTSPKAWRRAGDNGELVELPSGNVVRSIRPGLEGFVELGMVPNSLTAIAEDAIHKNKAPDPRVIAQDQVKLEETAKFMDEVFVYCVKDPVCAFRPEDPAEHDEDVLYIDDVDMEDKVFLFQFVSGGTRSVQRFREQRLADMAALADESLTTGAALAATRD